MKFTIGTKNVRVFAKAMRFLARYSIDLFINALPDCAQFKVVNKTQSVIAEIRFGDVFFVKYEPSANKDDNEVKIPLRAVLNSLKNCRTSSGLHLYLDLKHDCFVIENIKENGMECFHEINLMELEDIDENNELLQEPNLSEIVCKPNLFKRLQGSSTEIRELKLRFEKAGVLVENFVENADEDCRSVRLHYMLEKDEFATYDLKYETSLVFDWNDFEGMVEVAQQIESDLRIQFSKTGKPIIVFIDTENDFTIRMVEMTLSDGNMRQKKKFSKVLTYKSQMQDIIQDLNVTITGSAMNRILSPSIAATDALAAKNNLTDKEMDGMISAAQQTMRPNKDNNATIRHISSDEMEDGDVEMRDIERVEQFAEIPVIETAQHSIGKSQASKQSLSQFRRINEESQPNQTDYFIPNSPTKHGDDVELGPTPPQPPSQKISTQDQQKIAKIGNLLFNRKPDEKFINSKKLCVADSDSD